MMLMWTNYGENEAVLQRPAPIQTVNILSFFFCACMHDRLYTVELSALQLTGMNLLEVDQKKTACLSDR